MSPLPFGILASAGGVPPAYEHIATVSGASSSYNFNSIPQLFKHLEVRWSVRADYPVAVAGEFRLRFNGDVSTTYFTHWLRGDGRNSSTGVVNNFSGADNNIRLGEVNGTTTPSQFAMGICQIPNYTNTNAHKTVLTLTGITNIGGSNNTERASLYSGYWGGSTSAITSISFFTDYNNLSGTRVSLYGIRG